jgi:formate hydrogenlyase subunit 6/NADH:ubiquinone oxidoreductase subunit I
MRCGRGCRAAHAPEGEPGAQSLRRDALGAQILGHMSTTTRAIIDVPGLAALFAAVRTGGWEIVGPTVRDGAIVYDTIASPDDLPRGFEDDQDAGRYGLRRRADQAFFAHVVGPHSWKRYLHPPVVTLFRAHRGDAGLAFEDGQDAVPKRAFFGVRACELAAIAVQDRVFLGGVQVDPVYAERRDRCLLIAVNCTRPGGTCFCASMDTGPRAKAGFDLALTELLDPEQRFLVEVGSPRGETVLREVPHRPAAAADVEAADALLAASGQRMGRALETQGLKELMYGRYEDGRWDEIGRRCLTCTNCTQVCPTCFCTTVEDVTDLTGHAERRRRWDSCFTLDFSYVHGGSVRTSPGARYRQWITHKLATWHDQFGSSGCVGCGRCITWCPVGIDITAEARALRAGGVEEVST